MNFGSCAIRIVKQMSPKDSNQFQQAMAFAENA
jgi:hypothetical protein